MEFGLGLMNYPGCWDDAAFAEQHGFSTAGFVDSPILSGDPFVCMALAAKATSTMRLGTLLSIPGLRSPVASASAIATVNHLAPGRVFFGVGTGFTARQPLGFQRPIAVSKVCDYVRQVRDLLAGREIVHRVGDHERHVRLKYGEKLRVDPENPVPVYLAADGPQALRGAGEVADGLITALQGGSPMDNASSVFTDGLAALRRAAAENGRDLDDAYTMYTAFVCVLEPGESAFSPRVLEHVGPVGMTPFHYYACNPAMAEYLPPAVRDRIEIYEKEVLARFDVPRDRLYQEVHAGHLSHLLDGEAAVLTEEIVRSVSLTGTAEEIATQLRALESAGLKNVTFWIPPRLTREVVLSIEERIMPLLGISAPA
ncbi:MAG TPA: LLM class flavin-dependent oxidoreductase [Amycolatopsis sp.]|uniref:LLM class flavin-dependent oxidoreductase n=1 Tax=Amycolatopsis sp. TaxID=37632 RepID=UPI002B486DFB|nr:LLM class flavin-dependent oxidoreductase [Amycolatopsis sp.]HJQ48794.1 LLM class flavin-dependent oxidoreductase [Amycolatopsis sp.]HKS50204.1 LLM class flavin-dependent oxidoreductase [Amycolatopsis sp.]